MIHVKMYVAEWRKFLVIYVTRTSRYRSRPKSSKLYTFLAEALCFNANFFFVFHYFEPQFFFLKCPWPMALFKARLWSSHRKCDSFLAFSFFFGFSRIFRDFPRHGLMHVLFHDESLSLDSTLWSRNSLGAKLLDLI